MRRWLYRHTEAVLFGLYFLCGAYVLYSGISQRLFSYPPEGTDQRSMLECALALVRGGVPAEQYRYSYGYTLFLAALALVSCGRLWLMRLLQLAVVSLIPPLVMRTARLLGFGRVPALVGALFYAFYAPALLVSLDFLRAAPLALVFLLQVYFICAARFRERRGKSASAWWYAAAGLCAALCVLGRENFLAVAFWPPLLMSVGKRWRSAAVYLTAAVPPLLAAVLFNGMFYGSFQLVPGNVGNIAGFYGGHGGAAETARNLFASIPGHLRDMCLSYELHNSLSVYAHRELVPLLRVLALPFNLLLALGALGALLRIRERGARLCALSVAAYFGSMAFFTVFYRFRIPAVPLLCVLAAGGVGALVRLWKLRRFGTLAPCVAAVLIFCAFTAVDPTPRRSESERAAVARIMIFNRKLDEAERYLDRMLDDGLSPRAELAALARALAGEGDAAGAQRVISRLQTLSKLR